MFGIGWSNFVREAEIRVGDTCIFECTGNRLEFNICIERHEAYDFTVANLGSVVLSFLPVCFNLLISV